MKVDLINNGPAVLDANITFTAVLSNPSGVTPTGSFYCVFYDELGQTFTVSICKSDLYCPKLIFLLLLFQTNTMDAVTFNFTISYPSSHFKKGIYRMDVTVYKQEYIFPMPQGSAATKFELTGILNFSVQFICILILNFTFNRNIEWAYCSLAKLFFISTYGSLFCLYR